MTRNSTACRARICLVAILALPLGGCVAGMAMSAAGMAARSAKGRPQSNAMLAPDASAACKAEAGKHGTPRIIDVEQRSVDRLVVWGTVETTVGRQSFECVYGTRLVDFKLRPIRAPK